MKPTNKAGQPVAEPVEPRAGAEGTAGRQSTLRAQNRKRVTQALDRVRQAAQERKKERFTTLLHHISIDLLRLAFFALKRDAAPGIDGLVGLRNRPRASRTGSDRSAASTMRWMPWWSASPARR
jgi:hypothetical protein